MLKALIFFVIAIIPQGCFFVGHHDRAKIKVIDKEFKNEVDKNKIAIHILDDEYGLMCLRIRI